MALRKLGSPWSALLCVLLCLPAAAANYEVQVGPNGDDIFVPDTLTINVGDSVTWRYDVGVMQHNVVANGLFRCARGCDGEGGSGAPSAASWSVTRTFNAATIVNYYCEVHRAIGMKGTITVKDASSSIAIGPGFTGHWYDPAQSGHGIFVEILPENRFLAWWFAFNPEGTQQSWFGGVGTYAGDTATIPEVQIATGGKWIPNFDPSKVVRTHWGSVTFKFSDCNTGRVDFNAQLGYGTNGMNLTRLTQPAGLSCP